MSLGTANAPNVRAFTNAIQANTGTFLLMGDTGDFTGTLAPNTLNPFGNAAWQSASISSGTFNTSLINTSGDIVVVTSTDPYAVEVIGQWAVIPEPRHASFLAGALALGFLALRRRKSRA